MIRDYIDLTKPRVTWLILISAAVGYFFGLAAHGWRDVLAQTWSPRLLHTLLGTAFMASGTAALNEWYERDADSKMRRTARRPIPAGKMKPRDALGFGIAISLAGFADLALFANWPAALLGLSTLLLYLCVYTPLKSRSPLCTTAGAIPGALPPAIGFAAAHGSLTLQGAALVVILFVWQFPHFYSIAWMYRDDYARAGIKMLPVIEPDCSSTARQIVGYAIMLLPISMLPVGLRMSGALYATGALVLGIWLLCSGVRLLFERTNQRARNVLLTSVSYLPLLYIFLMFDRRW